MGATRRLDHVNNPIWHDYFVVAAFGAALIGVGIAATVAQVVLSIVRRDKLKDTTGDPWNGRTLEWATSSPPAFYNFATLPQVKGIDAFWTMKQEGTAPKLEPAYGKIHMPRNTGTGVIIGILSIGLGFALTWHIWWMAAGSFLAMLAATIWHSFDEHRDWFVPSETVAKTEAQHFNQQLEVVP